MTQPANKSKPWRDEELLRELYHDRGMSQQDISDYFDNEITQAGIGGCLDRYGIEKRSRSEAATQRWLDVPLNVRTDPQLGYEIVQVKRDGKHRKLLIHRLLAVAVYGVDAVKGKVVHHKNGIPWDNRPDNIELMTAAEHATHHHHTTELQP